MRLVQVGVRGQGNHWIGVGRRCPEAEVVGYVDVLEEHLAALRQEHGIAPAACFTDLGRAIEALGPDGVLCVTPPRFHRDVAVTALGAGCHVLTEKPLADTWEACLQMVEAADRAGRVLMVGQNYRYSRPVQTLRAVVADGRIGRPGQVTVEFFKGPHFGGFRDQMPHPLIVDMSIHHFDMMRFVLGADPTTLYARSWNPSWSWYAGDASATVFLQMHQPGRPDPVSVTYTGSWCANGGGTPWNGHWQVLCEDGCVRLWGDRVQIQRRDGQPWEDVPEVPLARGGQDHLLFEFVSAVREGRQPETSGRDNLRSIEMVFGTVRSCETGQGVALTGR